MWRHYVYIHRMADTKRGTDNPMFGKPSPRRRKVVGPTGVVYDSITAAAKSIGVRIQALHNMLTGLRPNSSGMRFV